MVRGWPVLRVSFVVVIAGILLYRGFFASSSPPILNSSADFSFRERLKRLVFRGAQPEDAPRSIRVTVHVFEARSTGILPLALPPLGAAAVSRPGDRVFEIIRDTAQYYDRLNALYPDAHFELLTAEEGMIVLKDAWSGDASAPDREGLTFHAQPYTIHVSPMVIDASDWLRMQVTVEYKGRFLLGNTITRAADGTPMVVGGPVGGADREGGHTAVFVGVTVSFIPTALVEQARVKDHLFQTDAFDRPPQLIKLAQVGTPTTAGDEDVEGMSIFLTHIDRDGRVAEATLVASLRPAYDKMALGAIRRSRFAPAMRNGRRVDSWMAVPVQFVSRRRAPEISASRSGP